MIEKSLELLTIKKAEAIEKNKYFELFRSDGDIHRWLNYGQYINLGIVYHSHPYL